jgi:hypothetical protein
MEEVTKFAQELADLTSLEWATDPCPKCGRPRKADLTGPSGFVRLIRFQKIRCRGCDDQH